MTAEDACSIASVCGYHGRLHLPPTALLPAEEAGRSAGAPTADVMLLYLNAKTYIGEAGARFAEEVRRARKASMRLLMIHELEPTLDGYPEFGKFFQTTPADLINDGLYGQLAIAFQPAGPHRLVSMSLAWKELGGKDAKQIMQRAATATIGLGSKSTGLVTKPRTQWAIEHGMLAPPRTASHRLAPPRTTSPHLAPPLLTSRVRSSLEQSRARSGSPARRSRRDRDAICALAR